MLTTNIQGIGGETLIWGDFDWQAELFLDAFSDTFQVFITYVAQGNDVDESGVSIHYLSLLSFQTELFDLFVKGGAVDAQKTGCPGDVPVIAL